MKSKALKQITIAILLTSGIALFPAQVPQVGTVGLNGVTWNGIRSSNGTPSQNDMDTDLSTIKGYGKFNSVRVYYPCYEGKIDVAKMLKIDLDDDYNILLGLFIFELHKQLKNWTEEQLKNYLVPHQNDSNVTGIIVGNEDAAGNENILINYINQIKTNSHKPIGSAQTYDYWKNDTENPKVKELADNCDFIAVNLFTNITEPINGQPNISVSDAVKQVKIQYKDLVSKYNKQVVITETGWPTKAGPFDPHPIAAPNGVANMYDYMSQIKDWATQNNVVVYWYEMFDSQYAVPQDTYFWNYNFGLLNGDRSSKQSPGK